MIAEDISKKVDLLYSIANGVRARGYDPSPEVEIKRAKNLAYRVEELTGPRGIAKELISLFKEHDREESSIIVARKIVNGEFSEGKVDKTKLIHQALKTSLGVLTEGVLVAPIEGIPGVMIGRNSSGSEYLAIIYAGPIRSAGGTAEALSVLIGDVVRREVGLAPYMATEQEIERWKEEIPLYKRAQHLQYTPRSKEIESIAKNCPVCIDGEGTEEAEVSGYRDLPRIKSNRLRGGACLVIAEGLCLKAPKIVKHVKRLGINGWDFISELTHENGGNEEEDKYLKEMAAGRPIFSYPGAKGGFRLRYGRCRDSGLAGLSVNPATMKVLGSFLAIGTQMKIEGPGKACVVTPCDEIEGPTVQIKSGNLLRIDTIEKATELANEIDRIVDIGEILVPFGEFLENNKSLLPTPWVKEIWELEAREKGVEVEEPGNSREAVAIARDFPLPLYPDYTYLWHDLSVDEVLRLREIASDGEIEGGKLRLNLEAKELLNGLLVQHELSGGWIQVGDYHALLACLGLEERGGRIEKARTTTSGETDPVRLVSGLAGFEVRAKAPSRIGARMGRPEKAKERRMTPPPHVLFPVGLAGGSQRLLNDVGSISVEMGYRVCESCGKESFSSICPYCSSKTRIRDPKLHSVNIKGMLNEASNRLGIKPGKMKGVRGLTSAHKVAERLDKGVIRSYYDLHVYKDGTCRYDMTDLPLTHFKPAEIGISLQRLGELGYAKDVDGEELTEENQVVSLHPQDVILTESCLDHLLKVSKFVDDELSRIYGGKTFYGCSSIEDLYGHLVIALAPHTSAGTVGRILGYTKVKGAYQHPFFHAAKRRNCLTPETDIVIQNSDDFSILRIKEVYETLNAEESIVDDFGTVEKRVNGLKTLSFNHGMGTFEERKIKSVIKIPSPGRLIELKTRSGRSFSSSGEHRIPVYSNGRIEVKKVKELDGSDALLVPEALDIEERDLEEIDLLREFMDSSLSDAIMVRGSGLKDLLERNGFSGLSIARRLGISAKRLSNYVYRDSVPLLLLRDILDLCDGGNELVTKNCMLGIKRNRVSIPRIIKVNQEFMRILGYYLSEGHVREGDRYYQVSLAFSEEEMLKDCVSCIEKIFWVHPHIGKNAVTISNRLVYHLFCDILRTGVNAHNKRVPTRFFSLPKKKIRELLRAYFSGDGSVEKGLHVTCSSVSEKLLRDLGLLLLRFGIFFRLKREKRKACGAVRDFYLRKGILETVPEFKLYYLSIRSEYARKFFEEIGFFLARKEESLRSALPKERKATVKKFKNFILDEIAQIDVLNSSSEHLYDIEVEHNHNFLMNDFMLSSNCDGDEDCVMLMLDGLINFSREYLPSSRGGMMDAPLVLTTAIDPAEIDKEAHNIDLGSYPLSFYRATLERENPKNLLGEIRVVGDLIGDENIEIGFTHNTGSISEGILTSAYKTLGSMAEKIQAQLDLAKMIRAVNEADMASKVIEGHLLPDLVGNLRAFSTQKFRCTRCNTKYRRLPLQGNCPRCGGNLTLTVHEASIKKYLNIASNMAESYGLSDYLKQRINLVEISINSIFENEKMKKATLEDFL